MERGRGEPPAPDGSIVQLRALATAHAAAFDAVNAFEKRYAFYLSEFQAPAGALPEAAAATAMHGVLAALVPAEKARLDATLARLLAKIPDGAGKEAGLGFGREVAEAHLAERRKDRMDGKAEHIPGTQAGEWRPTPPGNFAMAAPHVVDVVPFTAKDFAFLQVKGPPALTSADYARDLAEVARLGARGSTERTGDQTLAAIFWSVSTAGPWEAAARAAAAAAKLDLLDSARLFALVNMAGVDGYYAGWQLKRKFNLAADHGDPRKRRRRPRLAAAADDAGASGLPVGPHHRIGRHGPGDPQGDRARRGDVRLGARAPDRTADPELDQHLGRREGRRRRAAVGRHPLPQRQ